MSANRTARRFRDLLQQQEGVAIPDSALPTVALIFQAMIQEIQQHAEAQNLNVPSEGFTYDDEDGTTTTTKEVDGISTTGTIPQGNFR